MESIKTSNVSFAKIKTVQFVILTLKFALNANSDQDLLKTQTASSVKMKIA